MKIEFINHHSIIDPEVTRNDNIIYVNPHADIKNNTREIAEVLSFAHIHNVTFDNYKFLEKLSKEELVDLKVSLPAKYGVSIFDMRRTYGLEEAIKTIAQYLRDYDNFNIPREFYDPIASIKTETPPRTIRVLAFGHYADALNSIANSSKNPTSKELKLLQITQNYIKEASFNIIRNRNVLYELALRIPKMKFICHTTSNLRTYIKARTAHATSEVPHRTLKTSDKTFIMRTLDGLDKHEVLCDFATHRGFWKRVESAVVPTKKRYKHFAGARELFRLLRDNDFSQSNNSIIENSKMSLDSKFSQMKNLKSANFAIRNVTRLLRQDHDYGHKEICALANQIENSGASLKQLLELWKALDYSDFDTSAVRVRQGFWEYERKPILWRSSRILFDELKKIIKNIAKRKYYAFCEKLKTDETLLKRYESFPEVEIPNRHLMGIAIPTSTDGFFDIDYSKHYITRGSMFELDRFLNPEDGYSVFVAWKAKDNKENHQDLDLSCNIVYETKNKLSKSEFKTEVCNYTHLEIKDKLKHSGDWTSCKKFDPDNPYVVAELIRINHETTKDLELNFMLNCFNGVSIKNYDVYIGLIREEDVEFADKRGYINLDKAAFTCKLSTDITGYLKLFTIQNRQILFECAQLNDKIGVSSYSSARAAHVSAKYFDMFTSFDMADFCEEMLEYPKDTHNPYKLNEFMTYILA